MIYLSDEEQEIFNEGFSEATSNSIPFCSYYSGTLGHDLWWKGFRSALFSMLNKNYDFEKSLEILNLEM
jgi:hypothetical protein